MSELQGLSGAPAGTLITISELHRLATFLGCRYDVDAHHEANGHWVVIFTIADRRYGLSTVRGQLRRWRRLEPLLTFLRAHCQYHDAMRLHTGSWTFSRSAAPDN